MDDISESRRKRERSFAAAVEAGKDTCEKLDAAVASALHTKKIMEQAHLENDGPTTVMMRAIDGAVTSATDAAKYARDALERAELLFADKGQGKGKGKDVWSESPNKKRRVG